MLVKLMQKTYATISISRPLNFIITFFSVLVATQICSSVHQLDLKIFLASLSASICASAGNIFNDLMDINVDRINRPDRILPRGLLTDDQASKLYFIFMVSALIIAIFVNIPVFLITVISTLIIFSYSLSLKRIPLIGNIAVAFLTAITFIYGGFVVDNPIGGIIPAVFAFLINFIREILKDMEDLEGDTKKNIFTFPARFGFTKSKIIILISVIILIIATFIPFVFEIYQIYFFILVMMFVNPALIYFTRSLFKDSSKKNLSKLSLVLKINMIVGLIAIYLGR